MADAVGAVLRYEVETAVRLSGRSHRVGVLMQRLAFKVRVRLLTTEAGGRKTPLRSDARLSWSIGNPTHNDARLYFAGELIPGETCDATLRPLFSDAWEHLNIGANISLQEGTRSVGQATITDLVIGASAPPEVVRFVGAARRYCDFVQEAGMSSLQDRVLAARVLLLELYVAAVALPRSEAPDGMESAPVPPAPSTWSAFEQYEHYWEIFDPYAGDRRVAGSLTEDLLDVYLDVCRGLSFWDGAQEQAAIWEWRTSFDTHWGTHAIDALWALHRACQAAHPMS